MAVIPDVTKSQTIIPLPSKLKIRRVLEALEAWRDGDTRVEQISHRKCTERLLRIDSALRLDQFKFGVAFLDRFDTSEHQMLANSEPDMSVAFLEFLMKLGDKISLRGRNRFSGGLDVSDEQLTGEYALYRENDNAEAIFHVTPWLLAHSEGDLERKRHFGNDTVVIIFSESLYAFEMNTLLSQQTRVVFFVRFINRIRQYQVYVFAKQPISFLPDNPFYISENDNFESFFELIVEAERSCYRNHPLKDKILLMRKYYLQQLFK